MRKGIGEAGFIIERTPVGGREETADGLGGRGKLDDEVASGIRDAPVVCDRVGARTEGDRAHLRGAGGLGQGEDARVRDLAV